jgi:hypothetical protein
MGTFLFSFPAGPGEPLLTSQKNRNVPMSGPTDTASMKV